MQDLRAGTILLAANAGPPVRTARGWVIVAAPVFTIVFFMALLIGGFVAAMFAIKPMPSPAVLKAYGDYMDSSPYWIQGFTVLQDALLVFTVWLLLPKHGPAALSGYFRRVSGVTVAMALISGTCLAFAVTYAIATLEIRHVVTFHETATEHALVPHTAPELAPGFIAIALAAPLAEELYFRGVLLRWLRTKMHLVWAALLSAAFFGLIHFRLVDHPGLEGWVLTGGIATLGFVNALWAAGTNSLWPAVAVHGAYNTVVIALSMAAPYLPNP